MTFPPIEHRARQAYSAGNPPLIDDSALRDLLSALDDDTEAVVAFVCTFMDQWPDRVGRIIERVRHQDGAGAVTAVRSVKVSSQMIGATWLTSLSAELEHVIRMDDFATGLESVVALRSVGEETLRELTVRLRRSELIALNQNLVS